MSSLDFTIGVIGISLVAWTGWKLIGKTFIVERQHTNAAAAAEYFGRLQTQKITPITSSILLMPNERAFFESPADLCELKPELLFPTPTIINLGKDTFAARPRLKVSAGSGLLVLTDHRLIFVGHRETRLLALRDVVLVRAWSDSIELKASRSSARAFYRVENPIIWSKLIDGMTSGAFQRFIEK